MVNAKNAFIGLLVTGLVVAAVGTKKFQAGNWDSISGDFKMTGTEAGVFTGRYVAENTGSCNVGELGASSKGTECAQGDFAYEFDMTNGEVDYYANNKIARTTVLSTGEVQTLDNSQFAMPSVDGAEPLTADGNTVKFSDGLQVEVSNVSSPANRAVRNLFGAGGSWLYGIGRTVVNGIKAALQSCAGAILYGGIQIPFCIFGIMTFMATAAFTGFGALLVSKYVWFMCYGVAIAIIGVIFNCIISGEIWTLWDSSDVDAADPCNGDRALMASTSAAGAQGGEDCDECRRILGGYGGGGNCRALNRQLGGYGGCRTLGGGGGSSSGGGCAPQSDGCSDPCA